jgi:hypothetical protein
VQNIPIHTWGGFGSQLFALALHIDLLRERNLRTHLVCHTSGITKRRAELSELSSTITIKEIDDFTSEFSPDNGNRAKTKMALRRIVDKLGLISNSNTDEEYKKVSFLVRQFRGHYSFRHIQRQTLVQMNDMLDLNLQNTFIKLSELQRIEHNSLSLHYRLGDLVSAKEKTFVTPERILKAIKSTRVTNQIATFRLSSDSADEAINLLGNVGIKKLDWHTLTGNSLDVISEFQCTEVFIGTNSKLSLWIVLLRLHFSNTQENWLPYEMRENVIKNFRDVSWSSRIRFY